jgi:cytochrome c-type biogenesis protein
MGIPFILFALGFRWLLTAVTVMRRHGAWVTRIGGALLLLVGIALVTGFWADFTTWLRMTLGPGQIGI